MNAPAATQQEIDIYKKRCEAKNVKVKRTYENNFIVTSVFPVLDTEEKKSQSIEITAGLISLMKKSKK